MPDLKCGRKKSFLMWCDYENLEHDTCAHKVSFQAFHWRHLGCPCQNGIALLFTRRLSDRIQLFVGNLHKRLCDLCPHCTIVLGPFNGIHSRSDSRFPDGERNRGIPLEKLCKISSQVHFGSLGTPYNGFHRHLVDTLYWARVWDAVGRRWVSPERFRGQSWEARCLWWGVCRWPSWHTASSSWRQIYFPGVVMGVTLITWQHNKCHRSHYHLIHSLPARWFRIFMMTT